MERKARLPRLREMESTSLRIRPAYPREIGILVEFNRALALETEGRGLDEERLRAGVEAVFADPSRGTYYLALRGDEPQGGGLCPSAVNLAVNQLGVTEWTGRT